MARPIRFDPAQVLQIAARVFFEQGYANTGVADIVARAGVSRHSLYARWGDKEGLFQAALPVYRAYAMVQVLGPLQAPADHRGVLAFLDGLSEGCQSQAMPACLLVQSLIEQPAESPASRLAKTHFDQAAQAAMACVRRSQEGGLLDPNFDAQSYGQLLSLTLQGLNVSRRAGLDVEQTRGALGLLRDVLTTQEIP